MTDVPMLRLRRTRDLVSRIEDMAAEARNGGLSGLAYVLENALVEARIYQRQLADEHGQRLAAPSFELRSPPGR